MKQTILSKTASANRMMNGLSQPYAAHSNLRNSSEKLKKEDNSPNKNCDVIYSKLRPSNQIITPFS